MLKRFSVAIAEDETRIRTLIKALIDWKTLPIDLLWEASNGSEALHSLSQQPVDILITDIKMPGIDGLELAKWINSTNSTISIIVVSGYKHFEYVYDALHLNVIDYLLKPIKANELNDAIKKAIAQSSSLTNAQVHQMKLSLQKQFISDTLTCRLSSGDSISQVCAKYCLPFTLDQFLAFGIQFFDSNLILEDYIVRFSKERSPYDSSFIDKLIKTVNDSLEEASFSSVSDFINDTLYCVVNLDTTSTKLLDLTLEAILEKLNSQMDFLYTNSALVVSQVVNNIAHLPQQFDKVSSLLTCHCVLTQPITYVSEYPDFVSRPLFDLSLNFQQAIETQAPSELIRTIKDLFIRHKKEIETCPYLFEQFLNNILTPFWNSLADQRCRYSEDFLSLTIYYKFICFASNDYSAACNNTIRVIYDLFERLVQINQRTYSYPIKSTIAYMRTHYADPLSLESISEAVKLSPSYLSSLFSSEVGMTIINYLQYLRIEQSKKLLLSSSLNITEIAYQVGYNDEKYYSKIFKKSVGVGPKDYRKLNKWR